MIRSSKVRKKSGTMPTKKKVCLLINFVIKRQQATLAVPYRSCVTFSPAHFTNNFISSCFQPMRIGSLFSSRYSKLFITFYSLLTSTLSFPFFRFFHVTDRCPVSLRRAKFTQGLSPVATKSEHCN